MSSPTLTLPPGFDFVITIEDRDGNRFLLLFQQCWNRLPQKAQRIIVDYWISEIEAKRGLHCELSNNWKGNAQSNFPVGSEARVERSGRWMLFNAASFLILPEAVARFIIAHELANVYRWATGESRELLDLVSSSFPDAADAALRAFQRVVNLIEIQYG